MYNRKPPKGYRYFHGKLVTFDEYKKKSREEITDTIEKLNAEVNKVFESDSFKEYLRFSAKIPRYSFRNQLLLMMQHKEPTIFMGYSNWQKVGRHVIKGGKGCKILAPSFKKADLKITPEEMAANNLTEEDVEAMEKTATVFRFVPTTVFPLDQTEGAPLPSISTDLNADVSNYEEFRQALCLAAPCPVHFDDEPKKIGAYAYFDHGKNEIHCRTDMSQMDICASLIHEMAHAILHSKGIKIEKEDDSMSDKQVKEIEAEATAYSVSRYFGMDTALCSAPYIATYNGKDLKEKMMILSHIQDATKSLVDAIEPELMTLLAAKRQNELVLQEKDLLHSLGSTLESVKDAQEARFLFTKEDSAAVYINTQNMEETPPEAYYKFDRYEFLQKHGTKPDKSQHEFMKYIPLTASVRYENGEVLSRERICDRIYSAFQGGSPDDGAYGPYDYENTDHYSISIGDVIGINLNGETTYHYCDSFGWQKLDDFYRLEENPICSELKQAYSLADRILVAKKEDNGTYTGSIYSEDCDLIGQCEYPAEYTAGSVISDMISSIFYRHDLEDGNSARISPAIRGTAQEGDPAILLSYEEVEKRILVKEEQKEIKPLDEARKAAKPVQV